MGISIHDIIDKADALHYRAKVVAYAALRVGIHVPLDSPIYEEAVLRLLKYCSDRSEYAPSPKKDEPIPNYVDKDGFVCATLGTSIDWSQHLDKQPLEKVYYAKAVTSRGEVINLYDVK